MVNLLLYALAGAFFNSFIRGAFIDHYFNKYHGFGDFALKLKLAEIENGKITLRFNKPINALAFGFASYYHSQNMIYGSLMAVAMMIGQAPAIFDELLDHFLHKKMAFFWTAGVVERGLVWALPLVAASAYWYGFDALWWLLLAVAMPLAYSLCFWQDKIKNQWAISEAIFGACMWSVLVLL